MFTECKDVRPKKSVISPFLKMCPCEGTVAYICGNSICGHSI